MTVTVQDAEASAAAAEQAVDQAEADLVSGKRSISSTALHKLRDGWRYADLTAQRTRPAADEERRDARLKGLEAIGAEVDKLGQPAHTEPLAEALRDIAAAADRFRLLAAAHDGDVAELVAAARDLGAEPPAPAGPCGSSGYVAVTGGGAIAHKRLTVAPLGGHVRAAIGHAVNGDIDQAVAEVQTATTAPEPRRPDHVLRNRNGALFTMDGPLGDGMLSQIRAGDLAELGPREVERWMRGELAS